MEIYEYKVLGESVSVESGKIPPAYQFTKNQNGNIAFSTSYSVFVSNGVIC